MSWWHDKYTLIILHFKEDFQADVIIIRSQKKREKNGRKLRKTFFKHSYKLEKLKQKSLRKRSIILPWVKQLKRKHFVSFFPSPHFFILLISKLIVLIMLMMFFCCCYEIDIFVLDLWVMLMLMKWWNFMKNKFQRLISFINNICVRFALWMPS